MTDKEKIIFLNQLEDKSQLICKINIATCEPFGLPPKIERINVTVADIVDILNRQQADKDRLQRLLDYEEEKNTTLAKQMFVSGVKEFAEKIYTEINEALAQNHEVKVERINKLIARGIKSNDDFCYEIDGKILALRGIGDFIKSLEKEMVGEDK